MVHQIGGIHVIPLKRPEFSPQTFISCQVIGDYLEHWIFALGESEGI